MIRIINPATAYPETVRSNFPPSTNPWFREQVFTAIWQAGIRHGIDPVVLIAQSALETGWGNFPNSVIDRNWGNLAGMKNRNDSGDAGAAFARFAMDPWFYPFTGARAQADHLGLYAGMPCDRDTPAPRAVHVWPGKTNFGKAPYVEHLGNGLWATDANYGAKIAAIYNDLRVVR